MRYLYFIILGCCALSCMGQEIDSKNLCERLVKMYEQDQLYRNYEEIEDPFFRVFDSVRKGEGITKNMYMQYTKEQQLEYGKKIRAIVEKMAIAKQEAKDSLMVLQKKIDIQNSKSLLNIISKNGFPDMKKLNCDGYAAPFLIFVHSPEDFWDEIRIVVQKELKHERVTTGEYDYIMWHLNGRKGSPF